MSGRVDTAAVRRDWPVARVVGATIELEPNRNELRGCCPFHQDRSPSFYVFADGLRWHCFGCGATGDVLDFVQRFYGLGLRDAAARLYGEDLPMVDAPKLPAKQSGTLEYARTIWIEAAPIAGTPAEQYLHRRRIGEFAPDVLRYSVLKPPKDSGVEQANGCAKLPVMLALVVDYDGNPMGLQRTYLTPDGEKAASADRKVKFSLGSIRGGAIRLGPVLSDGLALTEGIEDALSLMAMGATSAWAAAGSAMLDGMVLPDTVRSVVIGGDADEAGRIAAEKAASAFYQGGREVRIIYPSDGFKDFNDELVVHAVGEHAL